MAFEQIEQQLNFKTELLNIIDGLLFVDFDDVENKNIYNIISYVRHLISDRIFYIAFDMMKIKDQVKLKNNNIKLARMCKKIHKLKRMSDKINELLIQFNIDIAMDPQFVDVLNIY
jgi:hypothetical protein